MSIDCLVFDGKKYRDVKDENNLTISIKGTKYYKDMSNIKPKVKSGVQPVAYTYNAHELQPGFDLGSDYYNYPSLSMFQEETPLGMVNINGQNYFLYVITMTYSTIFEANQPLALVPTSYFNY